MVTDLYRRVRNALGAAIGASLIEYVFLVALIAIVCLVAVLFLGDQTSERYSRLGSQVGAA